MTDDSLSPAQQAFLAALRSGEHRQDAPGTPVCALHVMSRMGLIDSAGACADCDESLSDPEYHCPDCGAHMDGDGTCEECEFTL